MTCPVCQQAYSEETEYCPREGTRLSAETRNERECPYCAERILRKARVCKHCGRDVEPLAKADALVQGPPPASLERTVEPPSPLPQRSKPVPAASRSPEPAKSDTAVQAPSPAPPQTIAEAPTIAEALAARQQGGMPAVAKPPLDDLVIANILCGFILFALIAAGCIWHLSNSGPCGSPSHRDTTGTWSRCPPSRSDLRPAADETPIADWELAAVCQAHNNFGIRCDDPHDPSMCDEARVARTGRAAGLR
jgi:DNA-directed RNA polymerase subunit RPC12/RpoP